MSESSLPVEAATPAGAAAAVAVPAAAAPSGVAAVEPRRKGIDPQGEVGIRLDYTMFAATWLVFLVLLAVLYKFALKPILERLDQREAAIRQSLNDADRLREEMRQLDERRRQHLAETEAQARQLLVDARAGAEEAAAAIRSQAGDEARLAIAAARHQIAEAEAAARANLRREAVELAVSLASRIVEEDLDDERHRELTDKLIREL